MSITIVSSPTMAVAAARPSQSLLFNSDNASAATVVSPGLSDSNAPPPDAQAATQGASNHAPTLSLDAQSSLAAVHPDAATKPPVQEVVEFYIGYAPRASEPSGPKG